MKINIDLNNAFIVGGIANFKRNLATELLKANDVELSGCYNWSRNAKKKKYDWYNGNLKRSIIPEQLVYKRAFDYGFTLPISYETMMLSPADVNVFLTFELPRVHFHKPVIATIHDIILLKANSESRDFTEKHERILKETISKSHHLITVSESAKTDIIEYFNVKPEDIDIVHNGIELSQYNEELTEEGRCFIQKKYQLPDQFILYFGGYRAHKNIERLLLAYSRLSQNIRQELKLVITNKNETLVKLANELSIEKDTIFTGFIDESDKASIYKMANMVYYASLYEGFGVPVIEAQICKTPVITSTTSSLPEASGGFAELVDPYNDDDILSAIIELYNNGAKRDFLTTNGFINSLQYTWQRGAKELQDILKSIN